MQHDPRVHRKMWIGVGISLLVVLGIWFLQLKQTVWRVRPVRISEDVREEWAAVREELDTVFQEEQPESTPAPASARATDINQEAVERLSEKLKAELP